MKEKIYTIPVNEAYEQDCECPLCYLEEKLEEEAIDYALGAAMMEPDYRVESNEKGYCQKHYSLMFQKQNKLSLALVLETHLEELRTQLKKQNITAAKGGLFRKKDSSPFTDFLKMKEESCIVCDKIQHTMERYYDVLLYLYEHDDAFRKKFEASRGVCLPHFEALIRMSEKSLGSAQQEEFLQTLFHKEMLELDRLQEEIHRFVLKFDYRNQEMEWGNAKDAPIRTIEKIAGTIMKSKED